MKKLDTGVTTTTTTKKGVQRINVTSPYFKEKSKEESLVIGMLYFSAAFITIAFIGMLSLIGYILFNSL